MPVAPFIKPIIKAAGEALVETKPPLSPPVLANSTKAAVASGKKGALVSRVEDAAVKFAGQTIKKQSFRARMANENLSANELKLVDEFIAGKAPLDPVSVDDFGRFLDARGDIPVKANVNQHFSGTVEDDIDFGGPLMPETSLPDSIGAKYSSEVYTVDTPESEQVSHHFGLSRLPDDDLSEYYAHIRKTRAIREDGKSVTVVHELQSDKHSGGKKYQYNQKAITEQQEINAQATYTIANAIQDAGDNPNDAQNAEDFNDYIGEMISEYRTLVYSDNFTRGEQTALANKYAKQMFNDEYPGGSLEGLSDEFTEEQITEILDDGLYNLDAKPHAERVEAIFDKDPKVYATLVNRTIVDSVKVGDSELRLRMSADGLGRSDRVQKDIYEGKLQQLYKKAANVMGVPTRVENGYLVLDLSNIKQPKHIKRMAQAAGISTPLLVALQARAEESGEFDMASLAGPILNRALRKTVSPKGGLKNTTDAAIKSGKKAALVSTLEDKAFELSGRTIKAQSFKNQFKGLSAHEQGILDAYLKGRAPLDKVSVDEFIVELTARGDILQRHSGNGRYENIREQGMELIPGDYKAEVYATADIASADRVNHHFMDSTGSDGYYGHVRYTDLEFDATGKKTRIIHEKQSDRHSGGDKRFGEDFGYATELRTRLESDIFDDGKAIPGSLEGSAAGSSTNQATLSDFAYEYAHDPQDEQIRTYVKALRASIPGIHKGKSDEQLFSHIKETLEAVDREAYDAINVEVAKDPKYFTTMAHKAIVDATNDGITTIRLNISNVAGTHRSKNVQETIYEGQLKDVYTNVGNKLGIEPRMENGYLVLDLDQVKQTPYIKRIAQIAGISTPLLIALQARADELPQLDDNHLRNLINDGYSDAQILEYQQLLGAQSEADGNRSNFNPIAQGSSAVDLTEAELPPLSKEAFDAENAQTLNARMSQIYGRGWHLVGGINEGWSEQRQQELENVRAMKVQMFTDLGLNYQYSETLETDVLVDSSGREWEIDESLFDSIKASPFEWGLAVAGGIGGFAAGGVVGAPTVVGAPATAVAGSVLGAAALGGVGAGIDQLVNAHRLDIHLTTAEIMSKVGDAAITNALFDLATLTTGKLLGTAYKKAFKPAYTATHLFIAKNWRRLMKGDLSATEDLTRAIYGPDIIDNLPQLREDYGKFYKTDDATGLDTFGKPYALSQDELDLRILTETRPEGVVQAGSIQGQLNVFTRRMTERTKAIQARSAGLADPKSMIRAQNELILYRQTVKDIFENVKNFAANGPNKNGIDYTDYTWDPELAVEPMLLAASKHLDTDRATKQFSSMMANIEDHLQTRKFSNLIELRKEIRGFKGNIPKNRINSHQAVQRALDAIDVEVRRVTEIYMGPEGARTYAIALDTARTTYGQMKALEKNMLYKSLTQKDGRTEKTMRSALIRALGTTETDGTYDAIVKVVPAKTRHEIEGVAIQVLEGKHTKGDPNGVIGINHPALLDDLQSHTWTSQEAKAYVAEIQAYANVFKADKDLTNLSKSLSAPGSSSFMTNDPKARAKYEMFTQTVNKLKESFPTQGAARLTLLRALERILPAPMEAIPRAQFIRAHKPSDRSGAARQLDKLAADLAAIEFSKTGSTLRLYQATATGQFTKSNGSLGAGFYVRKAVGDPREARRVLAAQVPEGQLAGAKEIDEVFGRKVDPKEYPKLKSIGQRLKKLGFKGILLPDGRGMLFDKP